MEESYLKLLKDISALNLEIESSGNISFMNPKTNEILIAESGKSFANTKLVSKNDSGAALSSDYEAHKSIYSARKDIYCIYHTHSHNSVLAAILSEDIPVFTTMHADYFGNKIKVVPVSNHRKAGFGDISSFLTGNAFLLSQHGGLLLFSCVDTKKILSTIAAFEEICRLYYDIRIVLDSGNIPRLSSEDIKVIHQYYQEKYGKL